MLAHIVRTLVVGVAGITFLVGTLACTAASSRKSKSRPDSGDLFDDDQAFEDEDETPSTQVTPGKGDAGTVDVPTRVNDGGAKDGRVADVSDDGGLCSGAIQPGDLRIVELMLASKAGQGDNGEWIEIQSSRACRLDVKGVTIESPRGTTAVDTVTIDHDIVLPPYGFFIVADSGDALKNGGLTGEVVAWGASDVLKNDGDTISITFGGVTIDTITYPSLQGEPGVSFAFPWDCAWSDRSNWQRWSQSVSTFGTTGLLKGTPNRDNADVACY
jgi:hypothetical protein